MTKPGGVILNSIETSDCNKLGQQMFFKLFAPWKSFQVLFSSLDMQYILGRDHIV